MQLGEPTNSVERSLSAPELRTVGSGGWTSGNYTKWWGDNVHYLYFTNLLAKSIMQLLSRHPISMGRKKMSYPLVCQRGGTDIDRCYILVYTTMQRVHKIRKINSEIIFWRCAQWQVKFQVHFGHEMFAPRFSVTSEINYTVLQIIHSTHGLYNI